MVQKFKMHIVEHGAPNEAAGSYDDPGTVLKTGVSSVAYGNLGVGPVWSDSFLHFGDTPGQHVARFNFVVHATTEGLNFSLDSFQACIHAFEPVVDGVM